MSTSGPSLALALFLTAGTAAAPPSVRTVALAGDPAPGLPGVTFSSFAQIPVINALGQVAFGCTLSNNQRAIFAERGGVLTLVALSTTPAPGGGGVTLDISGSTPLWFDDQGDCVFTASTTPPFPGVSNPWILAHRGGVLSVVARDQMATPSVGTYSSVNTDTLAVNAQGQIVFRCNVSVPAQVGFSALFAGPADASMLQMTGRTAPASCVNDCITGFSNPRFADDNTIGDGINQTQPGRTALFTLSPSGAMTLRVAQEVQAPPAALAGEVVRGINFLSGGMANHSQMVFFNALGIANQSQTSAPNAPTVLRYSPLDGVRTVARANQAVPGAAGVVFSGVASQGNTNVLMSDAGQAAVSCFLAGPGVTGDNLAIFMQSRDESLILGGRLAIAHGVPVFDMPSNPIEAWNSGPGFALNPEGRILAQVSLQGVTGNNSFLVAHDAQGRLRVLYRNQDLVQIRPGLTVRLFTADTATISTSGGSDGRRHNWGPGGRLALRTNYQNATNTSGGNGIFVISLPTCVADFNADGDLNPDDLGDFITCYFATPACPGAEFNGDGDINPDDLGDFITAYFQGC